MCVSRDASAASNECEELAIFTSVAAGHAQKADEWLAAVLTAVQGRGGGTAKFAVGKVAGRWSDVTTLVEQVAMSR